MSIESRVLFILAALPATLAACGDDSSVPGGGGAAASSSAATTSATSSQQGSGGESASSGGGGENGTGGSGGAGSGAGGSGGAGSGAGGDGTGGGCGAPLQLDPSFGVDGVRQIAFQGELGATTSDDDRDYGRAMVVNDAGEIFFGGTTYSTARGGYDFALAKLTPDGALDSSFGDAGLLVDDPFPMRAPIVGLAIDAAGSIVVASQVQSPSALLGLARLDPATGEADAAFGDGGVVLTTMPSSGSAYRPVGIQSTGGIVAVGQTSENPSDFVVERYLPSGDLDTTFGDGGSVVLAVTAGADDASTVRILPDDRILIAGTAVVANGRGDFAVALLEPDGEPDVTLAGTGMVTIPIAGDLGVAIGVTAQPDGKLVVAGLGGPNPYSNAVLARILPDGTPDVTFDGNGIRLLDLAPLNSQAFDVVAAEGGGLWVAGGQSQGPMVVARLRDDGSLDECFGEGGTFSDYAVQGTAGSGFAHALHLMPNGDVLTAGTIGYSAFGDFVAFRLTQAE